MCAKKYPSDLIEPEDGYKSRSRKKRESAALQQRGEELAALSPAVRKQLPLSADLREALEEWHGLKTWEAKRRHMQYIGRLMRELDDPKALLTALDELKTTARLEAGNFHHIEELRNRLLQNDEQARQQAIEDALGAHPGLDGKQLAHLVEAAVVEREKKKPPRQARALFRYLRDVIAGEEGEEINKGNASGSQRE